MHIDRYLRALLIDQIEKLNAQHSFSKILCIIKNIKLLEVHLMHVNRSLPTIAWTKAHSKPYKYGCRSHNAPTYLTTCDVTHNKRHSPPSFILFLLIMRKKPL